jgi:hypothetical protein
LFSLVIEKHCVRYIKEGKILSMTAITLCDFEEHKTLVPPGTAPVGSHFESHHFFVKPVHRLQVPDAEGHFTQSFDPTGVG